MTKVQTIYLVYTTTLSLVRGVFEVLQALEVVRVVFVSAWVEIIISSLIFLVFLVYMSLWSRPNKSCKSRCLAAEAVEGLALPLEGVDDIHGGDGLPAGVLGVGDGVTDDVLEEHLEDTAGLLVDEAGDALDTTPARKTADGGLGDALDVVPEDLAVPLGSALSESLSSLSASCWFGLGKAQRRGERGERGFCEGYVSGLVGLEGILRVV